MEGERLAGGSRISVLIYENERDSSERQGRLADDTSTSKRPRDRHRRLGDGDVDAVARDARCGGDDPCRARTVAADDREALAAEVDRERAHRRTRDGRIAAPKLDGVEERSAGAELHRSIQQLAHPERSR